MGAIDCMHCGAEVNAEAAGCPACGADPRTGYVDPRQRAFPRPAEASQTSRNLFGGVVELTCGHFLAQWRLFLVIALIGVGTETLVARLANGVWINPFAPGIDMTGTPAVLWLPALATVLAGAWMKATIIALMLRYVRDGKRAVWRDLGAGLPFLIWCVIGEAASSLLMILIFVRTNLFLFLMALLVALPFVFYQQVVVDQRRAVVRAAAGSYLLVRGRYLKVMGSLIVCFLCTTVIAVVIQLPLALVGLSLAAVVTGRMIAGPFATIFITVMYLLARGERDLVESRVTMIGGPAPSAQVGDPERP